MRVYSKQADPNLGTSGVPEIRGTFLGVLRTRIMSFLGPLILGNYNIFPFLI